MAHIRMEPEDRKNQILDAALNLAAGKGGIQKATRAAVARDAGVSVGLITKYFGDKPALQAAIVQRAVTAKNLRIIKEAIALELPIVAPRQLLRDAKAS